MIWILIFNNNVINEIINSTNIDITIELQQILPLGTKSWIPCNINKLIPKLRVQVGYFLNSYTHFQIYRRK